MRVSEIRVKRIRVNQGLGVFMIFTRPEFASALKTDSIPKKNSWLS